jgi:hypothetical protein
MHCLAAWACIGATWRGFMGGLKGLLEDSENEQ